MTGLKIIEEKEMNSKEIFQEVRKEISRAERKFPGWPEDPVHAAAILGEEAGEALQAALDYFYGRGDLETLKKELIQTAAMAFRFLLNLQENS